MKTDLDSTERDLLRFLARFLLNHSYQLAAYLITTRRAQLEAGVGSGCPMLR